MDTAYYKVIEGKLNRDSTNPQLKSQEYIFNEGNVFEMRANAVRKVKELIAAIVKDKREEFDIIPTKEQLVSTEFKSELVYFFEIRFITEENQWAIYSTLKNTLDAEPELFEGFLRETLWYKTNGANTPIYEFTKPFNGFVLQADFDFISARLQTLKQARVENSF